MTLLFVGFYLTDHFTALITGSGLYGFGQENFWGLCGGLFYRSDSFPDT